MAFRRKLQIADGSKSKGRYRRSARRIGAVAVCLGLVALLLLGVIIAMLGHYIGPCRGNDIDFSACPNLKLQNFQLQGSYNASLELKNQLDTELSFLTEEKIAREVERDALKLKRNALKMETESLKAERQQLEAKLERVKMGCLSDMWKQIGPKCYYIPEWGYKTWEQSQHDCESRGSQLATVKTDMLLRHLTHRMSYQKRWIGLSRHQYSVWRWVDHTDVSHQNLWQPGYPQMYSYEQSCATLTRSKNNVGFRDHPCKQELSWICEKDI